MDTNFVVVLVTTVDRVEAEKIVQALLDEKLIACANIVNPVTSFFQWRGKIDCSQECLVVMKSRLDLFEQLVKVVKGLHSYELPEVIAVPILAGSSDFLAWIKKNTH